MRVKIAMLGFGRVGRALARLLISKTEVLRREYDLTVTVTGITTHSHGLAIDPAGLDLAAALRLVEAGEKLDKLHQGEAVGDMRAFIESCPADLVMETTWLNPRTGQPATDYARAALNAGRHVVTANKGPVAFAYRELAALAREKDRGFFFESTVMDGAPVLDDAGASHFDLQIERKLVHELDLPHANALVRGLSPEAAMEALRSGLPLASRPEIKLSPGWWPWLPLIPFRISVTSNQ